MGGSAAVDGFGIDEGDDGAGGAGVAEDDVLAPGIFYRYGIP